MYFLLRFLALKDLSQEVDVSVVLLNFCQKPTGRSSEGGKRVLVGFPTPPMKGRSL